MFHVEHKKGAKGEICGFIKYFYKRIFEPMKKIEGNIIDIYNNRFFPEQFV